MKARNPKVCVEPDVETASFDDHLGFLGRRQVRCSGGEDANLALDRLRHESRTEDSRR